jgi:hypothetical protein
MASEPVPPRQPPGMPPIPGMFPGAQPLPEPPNPRLVLVDWILTLIALVTAIALAFGETHWAWWVLGGVSIVLLAVQLARKLAHLQKTSAAPDLPKGNRNRPAGTPRGRKLSKEGPSEEQQEHST